VLGKEAGLACRIYPNPSSDFINIEVIGNKDLNLNVYDVQGKLVFKTVFNSSYTWNATNMNGSRLQKGNYFLKLSDKNSGKVLITEKIIYN
jgi:flagellar hook assembly protein FlgD